METAQGEYRLGKRTFACPAQFGSRISGAVSEVVLSLDGEELACFLFEDELRPAAEAAIDRVHDMGLVAGILLGRSGIRGLVGGPQARHRQLAG